MSYWWLCISLLARGELCKSGAMLMSCSWMFAKLHWLDCLSPYNGSSIRAHQELAGSPGSVDSMLSAYKMDLSLPMRMRCWAASSTLGWKLVLSTNVSPLSPELLASWAWLSREWCNLMHFGLAMPQGSQQVSLTIAPPAFTSLLLCFWPQATAWILILHKKEIPLTKRSLGML